MLTRILRAASPLLAGCCLLLSGGAATTALRAQAELPNGSLANVVIEVDLARMRSGALGPVFEAVGMPEPIEAGMLPVRPADLVTFRAVVRMPEDIGPIGEAFANRQAIPMEFLVEVKGSTNEAMEGLQKEIRQTSDVERVGGTEFYRPPDGPANIAAVLPDGRTVLIGTDNYLLHRNSNLLADRTLDLLRLMPTAPVRVVCDLKDFGTFTQQIRMLGGMGMPAEMARWLNLIGEIETLTVAMDPDSDSLMMAEATGRTADGTAKLARAGNELLRLMREQADLQPSSPGAAKLWKEISASASCGENNGKAVFRVPAPAGFAGRLKSEILPELISAQARVLEANNLKQVVLAMHNYEASYRRLPQSVVGTDGNRLSWRVLILPFLEEAPLFNQCQPDQPPDAPANRVLAGAMPALFGQGGRNSRIVAVRPGRIPAGFQDITDGTSNTIAFLMVEEGPPWAQNSDYGIDEVIHFFDSRRGGSVLVAFYDGSVRDLPFDIDRTVLRAMLTPDGGEVVNR